MEIISVVWLDSSEFETIVEANFAVDEFNFCADVEGSNDTCYKYDVNPEELDGYEKNNLQTFLQSRGRKGNYMSRTLLQELVNNGVIPAGRIVIECSW